jgi:membrane protease YdiL (CAAX protease family)
VQKFPPLLTVLIGLVLAFLLFHVVIGPVVTVLLLMMQGVSPSSLLNDLPVIIEQNARSLLVANTIGQVLALALPIWVILHFHTTRKAAFIRFRCPDPVLMALALLGLAGLTPVAWWLGSLNESMPLPEWLRTLEESQIELIEQVLSQNLGLVFSLFVMAVTPAICEEILFRGYLQRQFERSIGVVGAILATGIIFGLFHFRLTQFIPLGVIGMYLGYLTWRSGSLWLAIVVHFANNAFAVGLGMYLSSRSDIDLESLERMDVPLPILILSFLVLGAAVVLMEWVARHRLRA